jgi:hypothetical protein
MIKTSTSNWRGIVRHKVFPIVRAHVYNRLLLLGPIYTILIIIAKPTPGLLLITISLWWSDYILTLHRNCHIARSHYHLVSEPSPYPDKTDVGAWLRIVPKY